MPCNFTHIRVFKLDMQKSTSLQALGVAAALLLAGCATVQRESPAPAHNVKPAALRQLFREQLAHSVPVKEYGYTIKDLKFSKDYRKALVVFTNTDPARRDWEFVLALDDFGRYHGASMQPFYTPGTSNTPSIPLRVMLPDE